MSNLCNKANLQMPLHVTANIPNVFPKEEMSICLATDENCCPVKTEDLDFDESPLPKSIKFSFSLSSTAQNCLVSNSPINCSMANTYSWSSFNSSKVSVLLYYLLLDSCERGLWFIY